MPTYIEALVIFVLLVIAGVVCVRHLLSSKILYWLIPFGVTFALCYESFNRLRAVISQGKAPDRYFSIAVLLWLLVLALIATGVRMFSTSRAPAQSKRRRRYIRPETEFRRFRGHVLTMKARRKKKASQRSFIPRIPPYSQHWIDSLDS